MSTSTTKADQILLAYAIATGQCEPESSDTRKQSEQPANLSKADQILRTHALVTGRVHDESAQQ
jgi:hypothetical protein